MLAEKYNSIEFYQVLWAHNKMANSKSKEAMVVEMGKLRKNGDELLISHLP